MPLVKIYHCTDSVSAESIMRDGFKDPDQPWRSIQLLLPYPFFSDRPIERIDGAKGSTVIEINIETTPEEMWEQFDTKDGRAFREFLIPSARINTCPMRILTADAVEEAIDRGGWEEYPPGEPYRFYAEHFADDSDDWDEDLDGPASGAGPNP